VVPEVSKNHVGLIFKGQELTAWLLEDEGGAIFRNFGYLPLKDTASHPGRLETP
jgi:hypothetical protein